MPWPPGPILFVCALVAASQVWAATGLAPQQSAPNQAALLHAQASPATPNPFPGENGQAAESGQTALDQDSLRQIEASYLRAEMEDSAQIAGRILADDYLGLRADGATTTKSDVMNSLNRHDRRRQPYNVVAINMQEHVFGDMACVTYTKIYTLPNRTTYSENILHIFTKRNGVWRLQVSSPLPTMRRSVP